MGFPFHVKKNKLKHLMLSPKSYDNARIDSFSLENGIIKINFPMNLKKGTLKSAIK